MGIVLQFPGRFARGGGRTGWPEIEICLEFGGGLYVSNAGGDCPIEEVNAARVSILRTATCRPYCELRSLPRELM